MDDVFDSMQEELLWPTILEDVGDIFYMDPDEEDEEDRESNEPEHEEVDWYETARSAHAPPFPVLDTSCRTIY